MGDIRRQVSVMLPAKDRLLLQRYCQTNGMRMQSLLLQLVQPAIERIREGLDPFGDDAAEDRSVA